MKRFIESSGEYNYTAFQVPSKKPEQGQKEKPPVVWRIISAKCQTNYGALKSVDTFCSPKGKLVDWKREDVLKAFENGKIEAHLPSIIPEMRKISRQQEKGYQARRTDK